MSTGSRKPQSHELSVGEVAERSGIAVSALHFYESKGLIKSRRNSGNQRRYSRDVLRRVAVIKVAQRLGIPLAAISDAFSNLPEGRTPTAKDWSVLSSKWKEDLDQRIASLIQLRDNLSGCIGCGCLSLERCKLYNPDDRLAEQGSGAVRIETSVERLKYAAKAGGRQDAADKKSYVTVKCGIQHVVPEKASAAPR